MKLGYQSQIFIVFFLSSLLCGCIPRGTSGSVVVTHTDVSEEFNRAYEARKAKEALERDKRAGQVVGRIRGFLAASDAARRIGEISRKELAFLDYEKAEDLTWGARLWMEYDGQMSSAVGLTELLAAAVQEYQRKWILSWYDPQSYEAAWAALKASLDYLVVGVEALPANPDYAESQFEAASRARHEAYGYLEVFGRVLQ